MFGKKPTEEKPSAPITAKIHTIPKAFYGGADPVIYQNSQTKSSAETPPLQTPVAPPLPPKPAAPPRPLVQKLQAPVRPAPQKGKKIVFLVLGLLLLLAASVGYYFYSTSQNSKIPPQEPIVTPPPVVIPPPVVTPPPSTTVSSTPIDDTKPTSSPTSTVRGGGRLLLPKISYAISPDDDKDTLTDVEEEVFEVDPGMWDTDKDGYYDGLEVINLYNPKGIAPQKIIDSGLVREYINPVWQYRLYYPMVWRVDTVDIRGDDVLISGSKGDYIEVRAFKKDRSVTFMDWFKETLPDENYGSIQPFQNRFKMNGFKRTDGKVAFFETETAVYSIVYFISEEDPNAYGKVMEVLIQSFRPSKQVLDIPNQPVLPGVVTPTTTVSTTPTSASSTPPSSLPPSSSTTSTSSTVPTN